MEFSPQTVSAVIQRKMNVIPKEDLPKYYNIDAVVYISEKHVAKLSDNRNACFSSFSRRWCNGSAVENAVDRLFHDEMVR